MRIVVAQYIRNLIIFQIQILGVKSVDTDVQAKSVTVEADDAVTPEFMLEKLEKWGKASGKHVALAA